MQMQSKSIYIERVTCPIYLDEIKNSKLYTDQEQDAAIIWYDGILNLQKYKELIDKKKLSPSKYLNKIPGMNEICYKYNLFKILEKSDNKDYYPQTFVFPDDKNKFEEEIKEKCNETWIMKPGSSYGGKGIQIFQKNIINFADNQSFVIQKYISPYLIDGHKFDLRLHILITQINQLTFYICKEGIARFCSESYEEPNPNNLQNKFQHLTNSSLNCKNINDFKFIRSATEVLQQIKNNDLWEEIKKIVKITIISIKGEIDKRIESVKQICGKNSGFFHLLGIDVLISKDMKPYVLELNDNPAIKNFNDKDEEIKRQTVKSEIEFITSLLNDKDAKSENWEKLYTDEK